MYRYFLVQDVDMPQLSDNFGIYHTLDLGSLGAAGAGWHAIVLHDRHIEPNPKWTALPRVADAKGTITGALASAGMTGLGPLSVAGLSGAESMLDAADKLGAIFKPFRHP